MRGSRIYIASAAALVLCACGSDVEESTGTQRPAIEEPAAAPSAPTEQATRPATTGIESAAGAQISLGELAARIEAGSAPLLLDVRSSEQYARRHIQGAINIPGDELTTRMAEIPVAKSGEIVVYSDGGERALRAEETLRASGYTNVHQLAGRPKGWNAAGIPTE